MTYEVCKVYVPSIQQDSLQMSQDEPPFTKDCIAFLTESWIFRIITLIMVSTLGVISGFMIQCAIITSSDVCLGMACTFIFLTILLVGYLVYGLCRYSCGSKKTPISTPVTTATAPTLPQHTNPLVVSRV